MVGLEMMEQVGEGNYYVKGGQRRTEGVCINVQIQNTRLPLVYSWFASINLVDYVNDKQLGRLFELKVV